MTPDLASQKQALRERLRFRRRHFVANLDPVGRLAAFRAVPDTLRKLLDASPVVGAYAPWGDEPDIRPLPQPCRARRTTAHCSRSPTGSKRSPQRLSKALEDGAPRP